MLLIVTGFRSRSSNVVSLFRSVQVLSNPNRYTPSAPSVVKTAVPKSFGNVASAVIPSPFGVEILRRVVAVPLLTNEHTCILVVSVDSE